MSNDYIVIGPDGKKRQLTKEAFEEYNELKSQYEYWDRKQGVRKVFLNSTYGALLNDYFIFSDYRFGQSTTLSGRVVVKHLINQTNKEIVGKYEAGKAIIYSDTDSVYFTLQDAVDKTATIDDVVNLADDVCRRVNDTMTDAMAKAFFIPKERARISVGRELVSTRGMFKDAKKRYVLAVADKEGTRENSMKIMGMDTKRAELPEMIRDFLKDLLVGVVRDGKDVTWVKRTIEEFKKVFHSTDPWLLGRFSGVSNIEEGAKKRRLFERGDIANPRLHFAVTAADNTNRYIDYFDDHSIDYVRSGDKIAIYDIRKNSSKNPLEFETIAMPLGVQMLPQWFKEMPFDMQEMENKFITKKVQINLGALGWNLIQNNTAADNVFG